MTDILWRKTGKGLLTKDGCPILCDKCPCSEECYSWVHYAPGMSTAEQKLNRLTLEVNGHSIEMKLSETAFYESATQMFVEAFSGIGSRTGHGYTATFRSESWPYYAEISFRVFEDMSSSFNGSYTGYHGKFLNLIEVTGSASLFYGGDYHDFLMSGTWRTLTNAPISEGGSVEKGVPLPFDLAMTIEDGFNRRAPSSMNLPGSNLAWQTSAEGEWIIGPAGYDETLRCNMMQYDEGI